MAYTKKMVQQWIISEYISFKSEWGSRGRGFESLHSDHYYEKIRVTAVIHRLKNKVAGASVIFKCHGCFTL